MRGTATIRNSRLLPGYGEGEVCIKGLPLTGDHNLFWNYMALGAFIAWELLPEAAY
jgi:hypothetical protein